MELEHAVGCNVSFNNVAHYHPSGTHIVYPLGGQVVAANIHDAHDQRFFNGHDDFITCLAVSHGGDIIASGQKGANADLILWDYYTGQLKYRWQEHDYGVEKVAFCHDDSILCSCGLVADARLFLWNTMNGLILGWVNLNPNPYTSHVCEGRFVKDIKRRETPLYQFASCGKACINLWHVDKSDGGIKLNPVHAADKTKREYTICCFSKDYEYLYAGTTTGDIACILMKNRVIQRYLTATNNISSINTMINVTSHGQETLAVGGKSGSVTIFSGKEYTDLLDVDQIRLGSPLTSMSLNQQGDEMLAVSSEGSMLRIKTKQLAYTTLHQHPSGSMTHVCFPYGSTDHILTCSRDTCVTLWDLNDYSARVICSGRSFPVPTCSVGSADVIVAGYEDSSVRAYDTAQGNGLWKIDNAHKEGVTTLNLARNMRFVVSGGEEGEIRVWEIKTKEMIAHLKEHTQRVNDCHLFTNDQYAISCGRDRCLFTWDLRAERRLTMHREKHGGINQLALANDQTSVVTVGQEKTVVFWDLREAYPVGSIDVEEEILAVDMSHNNRYICTGGAGLLVKLWDQRNVQQGPVAVGRGHSRDIKSIKFASDDKQAVSVAMDHSILVWNIYDA